MPCLLIVSNSSWLKWHYSESLDSLEEGGQGKNAGSWRSSAGDGASARNEGLRLQRFALFNPAQRWLGPQPIWAGLKGAGGGF